MKIHLHGDREIISSIPIDMVILSIEEEEEVEEDENGLVKDHLRGQMEGLEEVSPMGMEEEMEETHIR